MTSVSHVALAIGGSWLLWLVGLYLTSCGSRRRARALPDGMADRATDGLTTDVPASGRRATAK